MKIQLAPVFTDHAVFQSEKPIHIWGTITDTESAKNMSLPRISILFTPEALPTSDTLSNQIENSDISDCNRIPAKVNPDQNSFSAVLPPMEAGGPYTLTLFTEDTPVQTIRDIMNGEVWLAGGQSNMEYELQNDADAREYFSKRRDNSELHSPIKGSVASDSAFCDDTYCMNPDLIENAITERTKAVLPVHFYGNCCDMDSIKSICKKHGLYLITDCAQSAGTQYKGERKNTLGDVACFSFFPTKNLGCDGDGGMVLTNNDDIARACRSLKVHGSGKDGLWTLKREYELKGIEFPNNMPVGESKYYNYLIGYNSRLDAVQAAILRKKLTHLDEFVEGRRNNARLYNEAFFNTEYVTPIEAEDAHHSYYIYALKHPNAQAIMDKLKSNGVPCGTYYPVPLHLQGAFSSLGYKEGDLPITEELSRNTFAIPVFPELLDEEREYIIDQVLKALDK